MKILYICEKPHAGKILAKNMVALNLSGEFEDHGDYLESNKFIIGWSYAHLFQLRSVPGVTDNADLMLTKLASMQHDGGLCPDWPFESAAPVFFAYSKSPKELFQVLNTLIHREDVNYIVHAGDPGPDFEITVRIILHMAGSDKPIWRLPRLTTTEDELKEKISKRLSPIDIGMEDAMEGFRNMYFNFRHGNHQLCLGNAPENQAPTSKEEGLAQTLRFLTSGDCCKFCKQRGVCLDTQETTLCSAFSPSERFIEMLEYWL